MYNNYSNNETTDEVVEQNEDCLPYEAKEFMVAKEEQLGLA